MKYGNKKVTQDGIFFDSKKESRRYAELKIMQKAGIISDLELQKPFELIPAQYEVIPRFGKNGKRLKDGKKCIEKSCVYKADFVYKIKKERKEPLPDGNFNVYDYYETVVEDTKGMRTTDYIIKRKLMLYKYGIRIQEL